MPIYEYECKNCGYKFEQLQKMSDEPLKICDKCGKEQLVKLISNSSFQLKGTGWYVTDFKDKKPGDKGSSSRPSTNKKQETQVSEKPKETAKE